MGSTKKQRIAIITASIIGTLAIAAAGVAVANATGTGGGSGSDSASAVAGDADRGMVHPMEEALTGDDAAKVEAAVTAAYPDATIDRMEKDDDGGAVFEAHITKADGTHATVQLDAAYAITGEVAGGPGHGPDGRGPGHGPDGRGPDGMGHGPMEEALTGDDATKVEAAVTAVYPDATIDRMEKDDDGGAVFEAHITKADGTHATVQLDAAYAITGEVAGGPGHGPDGRGPGHGPDGMGPDHDGHHDGGTPMSPDASSDTDAAGATA